MLQATFSVLRQILLDLGFEMSETEKYIRFDHPETKAWFLYRPYRDDEAVFSGDLVAARKILDERGFLPREQFEEILRKNLIAG